MAERLLALLKRKTTLAGTSQIAVTISSATAQVPDGNGGFSTTIVNQPITTTIPASEANIPIATGTTVIQVTSDGGVVLVTSTQYSTSTAYGTLPVGAAATNASGGSANEQSDASKGGFFNNTGAVVGVFVVVGLGAAAILLGAAFFYFKRRRTQRLNDDLRIAAGGAGVAGAGTSRFRDDDDEFIQYDDSDGGHPSYPVMSQYSNPSNGYVSAYDNGSGDYGSGPYKNPANRMSMANSMASAGTAGIAGIGGGAGYGSSHSNHDSYSIGDAYTPHAYTPHGQQGSQWADYVNAYGAAPDQPSPQEKSSSEGHAMAVDQRLNPRAMLEHMHNANESTGSLVDGNDYSRPLRVANPA